MSKGFRRVSRMQVPHQPSREPKMEPFSVDQLLKDLSRLDLQDLENLVQAFLEFEEKGRKARLTESQLRSIFKLSGLEF